MSKRPSGRISSNIYKNNNNSIQNTISQSVNISIKTMDTLKVNEVNEKIDYNNLKCAKCGYKPSWCDSAFVPQSVINNYLLRDYEAHIKKCNI